MASVLADKENPGLARTPTAAAATRVMSKLPLLASARSGVAATPALAMAAAKNAAIQRVSALALADVTNSTPLPNSKKHFRPGLASAKQAFAGATATKPSVQQNPPSHRRTALSNLAGPARGTSKSPGDSASSAASSKTSSSRNSAPSRASATKRLISRVGNASNAKSSRFSVHHDAPPAPLAPKSASSNSSGLESRSVVGTDDQVFTDAPAAVTDRITEAEMVPNAAFSVEDNVTQDDDSDDVPSIEYAPLNSKTDSAYFLDELADFSNISKPIWSDVFVIRPVDDDSLSRISMESEKSSFVGSTLDSFEVEYSADIDDAYLTLQVEALMF
ncbi:hypothetical protein HDU84_002752 [Entophlyctis sp. JEL0112]|nr:hypothetical protein HDU84_002752 [Entophlyctis sp. JEL0112]